ncbi:MAG TPA: hypothetical protein VEO01_16720 [Pseudonocardiaceae bacterium]|nr:hypothetical protein [Pseudonocardiaceae bacterium]
METIGIAVVLLAVAVGLLYAMSFGLVVLFEHLQRSYRRRRALIPLTRRLHELLAEAGHPPVVRHSGGRHRRRPDSHRHRRTPEDRPHHYDDTITGELPAYEPEFPPYEPEYPTHDPDFPPYEAEPPAPAGDRWAYR